MQSCCWLQLTTPRMSACSGIVSDRCHGSRVADYVAILAIVSCGCSQAKEGQSPDVSSISIGQQDGTDGLNTEERDGADAPEPMDLASLDTPEENDSVLQFDSASDAWYGDIGWIPDAGADAEAPDVEATPDATASKDSGASSEDLATVGVSMATASMIPPTTAKIPKGDFWIGCNPLTDNSCSGFGPGISSTAGFPQVSASLDAYEVTKFEITVAQYSKCVGAGSCKAPPASCGGFPQAMNNFSAPPRQRHPANCLRAVEASGFCNWLGKGWKLPSELQWTRAALGGCSFVGAAKCKEAMPGLPLPDPVTAGVDVCKLAAVSSQKCGPAPQKHWGCGHGTTLPVGSRPLDSSPWGVMDVVGNVMEHIRGRKLLPRSSSENPYNQGKFLNLHWPPVGASMTESNWPNLGDFPNGGDATIGLAFDATKYSCWGAGNQTFSFGLPVRWISPTTRDPRIGFRCVRGASP